MTAIAGLVAWRDPSGLEQSCQAMLAAQAAFGPHARDQCVHGTAAVGRALFRLLPEDRHDRQPLIGGGGSIALVADVRIDNREELGASFGWPRHEAGERSDSHFVLAAYEKWGEGAFNRLSGAFAVAVWDRNARRLLLARDGTGQRPLHYHAGATFFAFATMPSGLHALPEIGRAPDEEALAAIAAMVPPPVGTSYFDGIGELRSGHALIVIEQGIGARRFWEPDTTEIRLPRFEDYVDAYREKLDGAVRAQLRGADGLVAAHLSSGFDSSAVAATAARLLGGGAGKVIALTSSPRLGYDGGAPRGRIADESPVAAEVAAMHPNMEHVIVRPGSERLLDTLLNGEFIGERPHRNMCNNLWWRKLNGIAAARGARVLLTGECGNPTISHGGLLQLADLVGAGRWLRWSAEARALLGGGTVSWRGILANSAGPWMPRGLWALVSGHYLGSAALPGASPLAGREWRARFSRTSGARQKELRPPRNSRAYRLELLQGYNSGFSRKEALARWGLDERDPTADQRLIQFCLSLPPEMLLHDGVARPLARAALADRLPHAVLYSRLRGSQFMDWHEHVSAADADRLLTQLLQDAPIVAEILDVGNVRRRIAAWPSSGWQTPTAIADYRVGLLRALSAAAFAAWASKPR